jgi:hypothetical protein
MGIWGRSGPGNSIMASLAHHFSNIKANGLPDNRDPLSLVRPGSLFNKYLAHPPMNIFVYPVLVACSSLVHCFTAWKV